MERGVPNLYTLVLELKDAQGKVTELTGCEVGFRTSEIKDGRFCINGVPVLVKGANRHEHSQLGRTVSKELMEQDIRLMKQHNINRCVTHIIRLIRTGISFATVTDCI